MSFKDKTYIEYFFKYTPPSYDRNCRFLLEAEEGLPSNHLSSVAFKISVLKGALKICHPKIIEGAETWEGILKDPLPPTDEWCLQYAKSAQLVSLLEEWRILSYE